MEVKDKNQFSRNYSEYKSQCQHQPLLLENYPQAHANSLSQIIPQNHLIASNLTLSSTNNATNRTTDEIRPKMIWPQSPKSPTDQQKLTSTSVLSALSRYWRETLKTNGCPLQMLCRGLSPPTATLAPVSPCGDDAQRT